MLFRSGLWLAHYTDLTDFNMMYNMWQYTDSGSVSGIEGYVDMNIYIKQKKKKIKRSKQKKSKKGERKPFLSLKKSMMM